MEVSWTAFRVLEVLKVRPVGSRGMRFLAVSIAVATAAREGRVVVRVGEEEEGPVMWRVRVVVRRVVVFAVSFERARRVVVRGAAIVDLLKICWKGD